ncbi:MAG: nucleoside deaminase [Clostridia bacterium]|nr:nucleoside deaminase [Clostridia bacterium]
MKRTTKLKRREEREKDAARAEEEKRGRAEKFMKAALSQARLALNKGEVPIGAVIVMGDKIIARGYNQRESKRLATAHAEMIAIDRACKKISDWRLTGAEIFVTLEPCAMCAGAIANARITTVYFGAYEKKGGACGSVHNVISGSGLNANVLCYGGVLEYECSGLIKNFFENKRNKMPEQG